MTKLNQIIAVDHSIKPINVSEAYNTVYSALGLLQRSLAITALEQSSLTSKAS